MENNSSYYDMDSCKDNMLLMLFCRGECSDLSHGGCMIDSLYILILLLLPIYL